MDQNVGGMDRNARLGLGIVLAVVGVVILADLWQVGLALGGVALVVGVVLLATGTTQKCPINEAAGIDTNQ